MCITVSTSLICDKNLLLRPSPLEAPLLPAISTNDIVVFIFFDLEISDNLSSLSSGT